MEILDEQPALDVTFYWQALVPSPQEYNLAIQLTSPIPGDDTLRFNYNTWPGRGNYPTGAWVPGQIIADNYRFRLPANHGLTQAWQLLVAFYETESGDRLPVRLNGQDVGSGLVLTTLRVPGRWEASRALLAAVMPAPGVELFWREDRTHPVGSTSLQYTQPQIANHLTWARMGDAAKAGARVLITEDAGTLAQFNRHAEKFGMQVQGLYELLAEHLA